MNEGLGEKTYEKRPTDFGSSLMEGRMVWNEWMETFKLVKDSCKIRSMKTSKMEPEVMEIIQRSIAHELELERTSGNGVAIKSKKCPE